MSEMDQGMNFGVINLNTVPPWKTESEEILDGLEQFRLADELGFHSAWVAEHNASSYGVVSSAPVYLAAVAAQTKRIKLVTAIARLPLYNPVRLAEELAFVDVISKGRLYVGVGKGYDEKEFKAYNADFSQRNEKFFEALDILKRAFKEENFTHEGKFFNFTNVTTFPRPVQAGGPPIFVTVTKEDASMINAAKNGYSFVLGNNHHVSYADARRKIALYRETALASGFSAQYIDEVISRSSKQLNLYVAETTEQAVKEYKEGYKYYYELRNERGILGYTSKIGDFDYDYFVDSNNAIVGSPEKVIKDIERFREETGLHNMVCWFNIGGQPQQQVLNSMRLFAEEVMPHFNDSKKIVNK